MTGLCGLLCGASSVLGAAPIGSMPYRDHHNQPPYLPLAAAVAQQYELGHAVFNTNFLPAGTVGAGRRTGLGPIFNAPSCDECHNEGAHGRGPLGDGPIPDAMVIQLEALPAVAAATPVDVADPPGHPVYGRVLSPAAVEGFMPEGQVILHYHIIQRTYANGTAWTLRQPTYELTGLNYGPLATNIVIKPRPAPALFGMGLLESIPASSGQLGPGRFGWQAAALTVRDQTTRALGA